MRSAALRCLLLTALCAVALLPALDQSTMAREKERRVVLCARHMAEGGSWRLPEYRGSLRLRKPPLMYWIVGAAFRLARTTESALAARLPSAAMGTLLVLAIYTGGALWIGRRRAFVAAGGAASSLLMIQHARVAEADIPLCLFTFLTLQFAYRAITGTQPARHWMLAGLFIGIGFMIKGPAALGVPLATLLVYGLVQPRGWRRLITPRLLWAVLLFTIVALPWYASVLFFSATDDSAHRAINAEMAETFGGTAHVVGIHYYFTQLPLGMMPWGLLLPPAIWVMWRRARHHAGVRFVLTGLVTTFALLCMITAKQEHYTVLLLPGASMALGYFVLPRRRSAWRWPSSLGRAYVVAMLIVCALAGIAFGLLPSLFPSIGPLSHSWAFAIGGLLIVIPTAVLTVPRLRTAHNQILAAWLATALTFSGFYGLLHDPLHKETQARRLCEEMRPMLRNDTVVYGVGAYLPILEYYLHRPIHEAADVNKAWQAAQPGDWVVLLIKPDSIPKDLALPAEPVRRIETRQLDCILLIKPQNPESPTSINAFTLDPPHRQGRLSEASAAPKWQAPAFPTLPSP
jgi:4-amino-4-deoxy-L-arabinose transferase-like glycosyltransferase